MPNAPPSVEKNIGKFNLVFSVAGVPCGCKSFHRMKTALGCGAKRARFLPFRMLRGALARMPGQSTKTFGRSR
jgi:hypothetical protein